MMFDLSENMRNKVSSSIKEQKGCEEDVDVFDCLNKFSAEEIVSIQLPTFMGPNADDDFFSKETSRTLSYQLTRR